MITIQNVSRNPQKTGLNTYEICITAEIEPGKWARKPIATFEHRREEGMAVCLEKAGDAIRKMETAKLLALLDLSSSVTSSG